MKRSSMRARGKVLAGMVLIAAALVALPFAVGFGFGNAWVRVLDFALLYIMLALGLNIVVGFAGLLDLGYIAFYAIGAYLYALLASPHFGLHWPTWAILPLGALVSGLFGIALGAPTLRLRGDYLAIVTLGFGEIIRIFLNNLNAPFNLTNGPQGMNLIDPISIAGFSFGAWIGLQLLMRRPEIEGFITIAPPANLYDFSFLAPRRASKTNSLPTSFGMPRLEVPWAAASIALCCGSETDSSSDFSGSALVPMPSCSMWSSILATWPIVTPSSIANLPFSAAPSCLTISGFRALKFLVVRSAKIG